MYFVMLPIFFLDRGKCLVLIQGLMDIRFLFDPYKKISTALKKAILEDNLSGYQLQKTRFLVALKLFKAILTFFKKQTWMTKFVLVNFSDDIHCLNRNNTIHIRKQFEAKMRDLWNYVCSVHAQTYYHTIF